MKEKILSKITCSRGVVKNFLIATPIGDLDLKCCPVGIHSLVQVSDVIDKERKVFLKEKSTGYDALADCISWLKSYFEIERNSQSTNDLQLYPKICTLDEKNGGGAFRRTVWLNMLKQLNFGQKLSYKELATLSGSPKACQAVGQAMRHNPVILIIPCHRVVTSSGQFGHYAGGSRDHVKEWLLRYENDVINKKSMYF